MQNRRFALALIAIAGATLTVASLRSDAARIWPFGRKKNTSSQDLWEGYKSVLLVPVANETTTGGRSLAQIAEQEWITNLRSSKKFSPHMVHPRSPVVVRAMRDGSLRTEDVMKWSQQPDLDGAAMIAVPLGIDFIGELKITGYELSEDGKALSISLAGALYDSRTKQELRKIVTSASASASKKSTGVAVERAALKEATRDIVNAFIGRDVMATKRKGGKKEAQSAEMPKGSESGSR